MKKIFFLREYENACGGFYQQGFYFHDYTTSDSYCHSVGIPRWHVRVAHAAIAAFQPQIFSLVNKKAK
jgi:hypothetical protein